MCGVHLAIKFKCERYKVPYNLYTTRSVCALYTYILKVCTWVYSCTADTIRRRCAHCSPSVLQNLCVKNLQMCTRAFMLVKS
jgi:hypothetical protein